MGTEDKRRVINDLGDRKCIAIPTVSDPECDKMCQKCYSHVLCAKVVFRELKVELKEELIQPASLVSQHRSHDMAVSQLEKCLRSVCRESSQLHEQMHLHAEPAMSVTLFSCAYVCPQQLLEVFNIHARLFSAVTLQIILLCKLPEYLANNVSNEPYRSRLFWR